MEIIDAHLTFKREEEKRKSTDYCVIHHTGETVPQTVEVLNEYYKHRTDGDYLGIGYHFYVRKDGKVYKCRDVWAQGGHCYAWNDVTVGVCFEGDYEHESAMNIVQFNAGVELLKYIKGLYPNIKFGRHGDFKYNNTDCPGKNFPYEKMIAAVTQSAQTAPAPTQSNGQYKLLQSMKFRDSMDGNVIGRDVPKNTLIIPIKLERSGNGTLWAQYNYGGKTGWTAVDPAKGFAIKIGTILRYKLKQSMSLRVIPDGFKLANIPAGTVITPIKTTNSLRGTLWAQCTYGGKKGYVAVDTDKGYATKI